MADHLTNEQRLWGGREFMTPSPSPNHDPTLVGRAAPDAVPYHHHGFTASNSDPLFAPTSGGPSGSSTNFALPRPPFPPFVDRNGAYIHRSNTPQTPTANSHPQHQAHSFVPPHYSSNQNTTFIPPPPPLPHHNVPNFHPTVNFHSFPPNSYPPAPPYPPFTPYYPPIQYIYVPQPAPPPPTAQLTPPVPPPPPVAPAPAPAAPLPTSSTRPLPPLTSIPLLNSKSDFLSWDESVRMLLRNLGIYGHILDPSVLHDPSKPHLAPAIQPQLSQPSTPEQIAAHMRWMDNENLAQYVLYGRLGSQPRQMVPPGDGDRSAREMYVALRRVYGMRNFMDSHAFAKQLYATSCSPGGVTDYVAKWRAGVSRLVAYDYPISVRTLIMQFAQGLPNLLTFLTLRSSLPSRIDTIRDNNLEAFQQITEEVADLDTTFRNLQPAAKTFPVNRPQPREQPSTSATGPSAPRSAPDTTASSASNRAPRPQHGGGQRDRPRDVAYVADALDTLTSSSSATPEIPPDPPHTESLQPMIDDVPVEPNVAFFVPPFAFPNPDCPFDLYDARDHLPEPSTSTSTLEVTLALVASDDNREAIAFIALTSRFNALLDSGCTHYIINDRALFISFDESRRRSIGTANCGTLQTLGTGDVSFRAPYRGKTAVFILRNCLYAPDCPINLISVGALQEKGMRIVFDPPDTTVLSFPPDHSRFPDFSLRASVVHRLSFLQLDFLPPQEPSIPTACPAYPAESFQRPTKPTSHLWHRRFGHLGLEATHAALTKNYVQGADFTGPLTRDYCIACVVGKSPQQPYSHFGNRATDVGELLHMDLCGPWPVRSPSGHEHFAAILDDRSNFGFTTGLKKRSEAFAHYKTTEAFVERVSGNRVKTLRVDGALELTKGAMGEHLRSKGIAAQMMAPYSHPQNGKIERYVRTLEDGALALLAESGLSMSFWLDAVLTSQYVRNRLPTSTLPADFTPYEVITKQKPDVSHLRVWGCQCFVAIVEEIRPKGGFKRFEAIFVGYKEHRIGWRVRDLQGKYHFSRDVIFNEDTAGRLGIPRTFNKPPSGTDSTPARPARSRTLTPAGEDYVEVLRLKASRARARAERRHAVNGGDKAPAESTEIEKAAQANLAFIDRSWEDPYDGGVTEATLGTYVAFLAPASFPELPLTSTLSDLESTLDWHSCLALFPPSAFLASSRTHFDLTKAPGSYPEALARPDTSVWQAAMDREKTSLEEMGAFRETDLPKGQKAVGLKWTFAYKTDSDGKNIPGKEKAHLVAQGYTQRPDQYGETYAPVAKMASVRTLLAWAAVQDLEIFQFDCKTAFLHAKLRHPNYARPYPGYKSSQPGKVLEILVALYGLHQSAYEFYMLLLGLLLSLGMVRCEVDHGVFYGKWLSPPDPSIPMPSDGSPLILYVPVHVDDGLGITNSIPLYNWFIATLSKRLHIVDLGPCSKFLSILIIRDRPNRRIWLSSHVYISELLDEWNLANCKSANTPFPNRPPEPLANSAPELPDADILPKYQRLVGCLLYLAITTRPDIAYYAMWLGQHNSRATRTHFLMAKHVLRYLAGTKDYALSLGTPSPATPASMSGYVRNVGCSDADWASDSSDRKSISGYAFFFEGSLVSWSAVKQRSIALSSTEAEYYAMTHAFKEALWLRSLLGFLQLPIPTPYPILCDNQAACALSDTPAISSRSKHIDIRHHFIRNLVLDGSFTTTWIPTTDMPADIFTKALPTPTFTRHREVLGLAIPPRPFT